MNTLRLAAKSLVIISLLLVGAVSVHAIEANVSLSKPEQIHVPVCNPDQVGVGEVYCHARVVADNTGSARVHMLPSGYGPDQFVGAYGLTGLTSNKTIAIVNAYDQPNIKSDLDRYNRTFKLPKFPSCKTINDTGCFLKVNQRGQTNSYPAFHSGWGLEISLDVQVAHGVCPTCKLILVEADSNSLVDLLAAEDMAVSLGADVISNSWGAPEFAGETAYDSHFNHPGVAITFSSGDNGLGVLYPAASPYVTAVGGTTLTINPDNTYGSESAWAGSGSGCSSYEPKPSWQNDPGCSRRIVADVSADADPATGAAVYDSCYHVKDPILQTAIRRVCSAEFS